MKRMTRCLCLLLGLLMLLGAFAACDGNERPTTARQTAGQTTSGQTTSGQTTDPATEGETTTAKQPWMTGGIGGGPCGGIGGGNRLPGEEDEDGNWYVVDPIDYDAIDYSDENGAREFRLLVCEAWAQWTFPREDGGQSDQIQSTAYTRNREIEDRLGVNLMADYVNGHGGYEDEWTNRLIDAMRNECALICGYPYWMAKHGQQEMLENLYQYQYPALEYPWYPYQMDEWSQYDCLFYVTGTCTTRTTAEGNCVFYEQQMLCDNLLADPAQLALKGTWTLSKLYEYTSVFHNVAVATKDTDTPTFGIIATNPYAFYYGMGNRYTTLNNRGKQAPSCLEKSNVQTAAACVDELLTVLDTDEGRTSYNEEAAHVLLRNKRAAFVVGGLINFTWIGEETKYAALPMPKRNLDQTFYYTITTGAIEVFGIPTSTPDGEMSAVVLEAVFSSDYRDMAPVFFEQILKGMYTNSMDGAAIFDLIRYSRVIDFGWINAFGGVHIGDVFAACFVDGAMGNNYAAQVSAPDFQKKLTDGLTETLTVYKAHGLK